MLIASRFGYRCMISEEAEIICETSVVFGYPIETKETIRQTFEQCLKAGMYPSIGFLLPLPATGMYDYAKQKGFITDEDRYLESITERQDICINMTKMLDAEIMAEIKIGAGKLNEMLNLGLTEDRYIKTKGYQGSKSKKKLEPLDPEKIKRIENDVSFNYAQTVMKFFNVKTHLTVGVRMFLNFQNVRLILKNAYAKTVSIKNTVNIYNQIYLKNNLLIRRYNIFFQQNLF